eukprot:1139108-Pelagomonas_calceolata.AAC.1
MRSVWRQLKAVATRPLATIHVGTLRARLKLLWLTTLVGECLSTKDHRNTCSLNAHYSSKAYHTPPQTPIHEHAKGSKLKGAQLHQGCMCSQAPARAPQAPIAQQAMQPAGALLAMMRQTAGHQQQCERQARTHRPAGMRTQSYSKEACLPKKRDAPRKREMPHIGTCCSWATVTSGTP